MSQTLGVNSFVKDVANQFCNIIILLQLQLKAMLPEPFMAIENTQSISLLVTWKYSFLEEKKGLVNQNYPPSVLAVEYFEDVLHHTVGIKSRRMKSRLLEK